MIIVQVLSNEDMVTIGHLLLHDSEKGWAKISSGLTQDFQSEECSFNVRFEDGSERCLKFTAVDV